MIYGAYTRQSGQPAPTEQFRAGVGGVKAGDFVYRNSDNEVVVCTAGCAKIMGVAAYDAVENAVVDVILALPDTVVEATYDSGITTYTEDHQWKNYDIAGTTGAMHINLADTTDPLVKVIGQKYNYALKGYVLKASFLPAFSQAVSLTAD